MPVRWFRSLGLLASITLNVVLGWLLLDSIQVRGEQQHTIHRLSETVKTVYTALPKDRYTRNEFALAITMPGMVPTVRDCMVQFGDDVFIFDRTNTLIGMYPSGPNPFVPVPPTDSSFKCDPSLLDTQTQRRIGGAREWEDRVAPARELVMKALEADDPAWGKR